MQFDKNKQTASDDEIICYCYQVTRKEIIDAIQNKDADTIEKIRRITGATSGCGTCRVDVLEILDQAMSQKNIATMKETQAKLPINIFNLKAPLEATVVATRTLATFDGSETKHVDIDIHDTSFVWAEGQSLGVLPPGNDEKGKPNHLRLYSIASSAGGENFQRQRVSICVKRVIYTDEETQQEKRGICSNYICDLTVGQKVLITGPVGKAFVLPETPPQNLILFATGTGIAPFRSFWRKLFFEKKGSLKGNLELFFGVPYSKEILYKDELDEIASKNSNFQVHYSISREQKNSAGGKKYIHHLLEEKMQSLWPLFINPQTRIYICGLKGMESGLKETFEKECIKRGVDWEDLYKRITKEEKRWEVEVY